MKTANLIGPALDWAVAKCEGWEEQWNMRYARYPEMYAFSTDWSQGGPIIEREQIIIAPYADVIDGPFAGWAALKWMPDRQLVKGPTPLVAAMRRYVTSKLGDEVNVPKALS